MRMIQRDNILNALIKSALYIYGFTMSMLMPLINHIWCIFTRRPAPLALPPGNFVCLGSGGNSLFCSTAGSLRGMPMGARRRARAHIFLYWRVNHEEKTAINLL